MYTFLKEETLGLLHRRDLVEVLHPDHTFLKEETLGLLHMVDVVDVPHLDQHLNGEVNEPLNGEVKEDEGEKNH